MHLKSIRIQRMYKCQWKNIINKHHKRNASERKKLIVFHYRGRWYRFRITPIEMSDCDGNLLPLNADATP